MTNSTEVGEFAYVELVAAVLLGLAAMAIAWCTYQSALWGGQQDEAYTESVRAANEAVDLLQAADTIRALDQTLYVEVLSSGVCDDGARGDAATCERILANMSDEGTAAIGSWMSGDTANPFESQAYTAALYGEGERARATSDEFFSQGGEANENGDNYELASTALTAVLFFAGISLVLHGSRTRWALLIIAGLLFVVGAGYAVTLPVA